MAKIAGNEIHSGMLIEHQGGMWLVSKTKAVKPGKGGAYNQVEMKNIATGTKLNERFRSDAVVEEIFLERLDYTFLFEAGDMLTFMNVENYEQIELSKDFVGEKAVFLQDGMKVMLETYEGKPIHIQMPIQVTLTVTETDPVVKGGTAAPSYKGAVLENGVKTSVPPFISVGERIIVNVEDASYAKRGE